MGLHRVIRRYREKGSRGALRYVWRLQRNNLVGWQTWYDTDR
jgi:hypothetical protein